MEIKMKRIFEFDINDDLRRASITQFALMATIFVLSFSLANIEKRIFDFFTLVELCIMAIIFNFYFKAQRKRNYSYWVISILLVFYLLQAILHYALIEYNLLILYLAFLGSVFLALNAYVMSSPLFFPRVQWWEYDFRYRGDLKAKVFFQNQEFEARLTDLRRLSACIEVFDHLDLEQTVVLVVKIDNEEYSLPGVVKTKKEIIPGRPIRYGVRFQLLDLNKKNQYVALKKFWDKNKQAKIRNKFVKMDKDKDKDEDKSN